MQVGLDPRGQRALRAPGGLLDPDLHPSRDRLPARDLRRLVPHPDADGCLRRSLREVAGEAGLEGARDPRDRERRRGDARDVRHGLRVGRGADLEPLAGVGRPLPRRAGAALPAPRAGRHDGRSQRRRGRRRDRHGNARARVARGRGVGEGRRAPRRARRRPRGRAGAPPGPAPARPRLRGRHAAVRPGRRDQRAAPRGADHRGRRRRRDRKGDLRRAGGPAVATTRSRSSTRPGSRCRTRPRCRSRSSARTRPGWESRRR